MAILSLDNSLNGGMGNVGKVDHLRVEKKGLPYPIFWVVTSKRLLEPNPLIFQPPKESKTLNTAQKSPK